MIPNLVPKCPQTECHTSNAPAAEEAQIQSSPNEFTQLQWLVPATQWWKWITLACCQFINMVQTNISKWAFFNNCSV